MTEKKTKTTKSAKSTKNEKAEKKPLKKKAVVSKSKTTKTSKPVKITKASKVVKAKTKATPKKEKTESKETLLRYYESVGRRKRAVARVRLFTKGEKGFNVNKKKYEEYFPTPELQGIADAALRKMKVVDKFGVSIMVRGGGMVAQAEATRHGIGRALLKFNPDFRKRLKKAGFLKRDPREKERRKFGLKKARRAPQWSKR